MFTRMRLREALPMRRMRLCEPCEVVTVVARAPGLTRRAAGSDPMSVLLDERASTWP